MSAEVAALLQKMVVGVMAVLVDNETNCGRDEAVAAVEMIMLGDYGRHEITAAGSYNIVKMAIEVVKQGREDGQNKLDSQDKEL